MNATNSRFLQAVVNEYRDKCPELSRIMTMKYFDRINDSNIEGLGEKSQWCSNACEHCGTVFTAENCTFRIKPKRRRRKGKKCLVKNDSKLDRIPKSSNFLQILCHYCGWKTRQIGATRVTRRRVRNDDGSLRMDKRLCQTPTLSKSGSVTAKYTPELSRTQSQPRSQNSTGTRKKNKSKLKELLAKEKLESSQTESPSLLNFLATI
ncbi:UPF0711 protein C18orf21 homolog [Dendronephthya gigantea]|uniref:UPF0711 protein C18orf21 homolog n=1 Tax=Dendronephthya gigantea TaxID=151771 RepID=UPI00106A950F|nr:UPF0711 protein C18orf21 homolog [Dendronephthya gigantea]